MRIRSIELSVRCLTSCATALLAFSSLPAAATEPIEALEQKAVVAADSGGIEAEASEIEMTEAAGAEALASEVETGAGTEAIDTKEGAAHQEPVLIPSTGPFTPPAPTPKKYDWIRLTSGEWLKGDLTRLRDDDFEFDSDELDEQTFDWEDVAELRSPKSHIYRFEGDVILNGPAIMQGKTIVIDVGGERREFPRERLIAIVPQVTREFDRWSGDLSLGATLRSGNTDQIELSAITWIRRETTRSRLRLDYQGDYGEVNNELATNTHRLSGRLDLYMTRNFYITPLSFEYYRDPLSNIDRRITPGALVGYHVFRGRFDLSLELGLAYQGTDFNSVVEGDEELVRGGAILAGVFFESELTKRVDFDTTYRLNLAVPDIGDTSHYLLAVLSVDLTRRLDLDVSLNFDRIEEPRRDANGDFPESNDIRLIVGLGLEF
jgi:hypothetical protein